MFNRVILPVFLAAFTLFSGCDSKVEIKEVNKPIVNEPTEASTPAIPAASDMVKNADAVPGLQDQAASTGEAKWEAPAAWTKGPEKPMRKATYILPGADGNAELSIIAFPGDVGGVSANVNRWRQQLGLDPVSEQEINEATEQLSTPTGEVALVRIDGRTNSILAGMLPYGSNTWFFKATGPSATLKEHEDTFIDFLKSVQFN